MVEQADTRKPPARVRKKRNWRAIFLIAAAVVAVSCTGTAISGYLYYAKATGPDLAKPDVAVDGYLFAFLHDRNDVKAHEYVCSDSSGLAPMKALREDIVTREKRYSISIHADWGALAVTTNKDSATVEVTIDIYTPEPNGLSTVNRIRWQFGLRDVGGWHVCSAIRQS